MDNLTPDQKLKKFLQENNLQIQVRPVFRLMKNGFYAIQNIVNVVEKKEDIEPVETKEEETK